MSNADTLRVGRVSSVDYDAGTVRVTYKDADDNVTKPLPLLSAEYAMPAVGDMVAVLHLGKAKEAGVVLGRYYSEKKPPPESGAGLYRKELAPTAGEAFLRYLAGVLGIKAATVQITGDLTITGNLTVSGSITAGGDVTAGGVSLQNHTHPCSCALSSGTTSAPS